MAVTTEDSVQVLTLEDARQQNEMHESGGHVRGYRFDFTQGVAPGDIGSVARLCLIPAGKVRVVLYHSRVWHSAFGAAATLDLGWEAYTDRVTGDPVAADPNGLDAAEDVAAAGDYAPVGTVGEDETYLFDSSDGVMLVATVGGAVIPAGARLVGSFEVQNR